MTMERYEAAHGHKPLVRDARSGRWAKGNRPGPGHKNIKRVSDFRAAVLANTSDEDFLEIWAVLVGKAKGGEPWAIREFLDRLIGKPKPESEVSVGGDPTVRERLIEMIREGVRD